MAALAFPISDSVIDKLELRNIAEIGNGKHRLENRLQTGVVTLAGQAVHLKEAVVRALLYLDQIRNLDRGGNFGKIKAFTKGIILRHSDDSNSQAQPEAAFNRGIKTMWEWDYSPFGGSQAAALSLMLNRRICARRDVAPRRRHWRRLAY